jgi:hypothetical protein
MSAGLGRRRRINTKVEIYANHPKWTKPAVHVREWRKPNYKSRGIAKLTVCTLRMPPFRFKMALEG